MDDEHRPKVSGTRLREGGWVYFVTCTCRWGYGGTGWENANLMAQGHAYLAGELQQEAREA